MEQDVVGAVAIRDADLLALLDGAGVWVEGDGESVAKVLVGDVGAAAKENTARRGEIGSVMGLVLVCGGAVCVE